MSRADDGWFAAPMSRDVVECRGEDAASFLQGQLSQDVAALAVGESAWSLLLEPQGKVHSLVRVAVPGAGFFDIDVEEGWGGRVAARLDRFRIRVAADLSVRAGVAGLALRGPEGTEAPLRGLHVGWRRSAGVDVLGAVQPPEGVVSGTASDLDAIRVEAGVPAMGAELVEGVIPAEAGRWLIESAVSFTKGCYVGQELVARVDSRGSKTPRHLRHLRLGDAVTADVGADVLLAGAVVGQVTSAVPGVALAYVHRSVEPPAEAQVATDAGVATARIEPLP